LASFAAAILETYVKQALANTPDKTNSGITFWAQGPQYIVTGLADVFSYIPGRSLSRAFLTQTLSL
jgi:rhamnogalacturonyl hydrolase YesR